MIRERVSAAVMPSPVLGRLFLVSLAGLTACLGCAGSNFTTPKIFRAGSPSGSPDTPAKVTGELPPEQAAQACLVTAQELQEKGHLDQAIVLYEKARRYDPSLKTVAHRLAGLYDVKGNSTQALTEYKKALELDPKNPDLLSDFGYYWWERRNLDEAERWLREALTINPNHQKALSNLAMVLADQGRYDECLSAFSKVVGPAAAYSNVGVLLAKHGRYDQARLAFREALAADPTLPQPKAFLQYLDARG